LGFALFIIAMVSQESHAKKFEAMSEEELLKANTDTFISYYEIDENDES